ncbi:MAG: alanine--glyoxylate aminotransferase family protein [Nitrososphaerota archaeon]|nr:alanine--glyoxylate aminotransferase family protein [Nitrososphaerota archaeon]
MPRSDEEFPLLMIPGPTNLHPDVLRVMAEPQVAHTSHKFYSEFLEILELTKYVFQTDRSVIVFSGSGTSAMEAAACSVLEPGRKVLSLESGFFGKRFSTVAGLHGADVKTMAVPEGEAFDPADVDLELSRSSYDAVMITDVETSTGVENPVREIVSVARKHGALTLVDAVASLGGCELAFDGWGIDVAFTASQKAIAAPPGAALMALSDNAVQRLQERRSPISSYYYDLSRWLQVMKDPRIYLATPSTAALRALRVALRLVKEEGIGNRIRRHRTLSDAFRRALEESGVEVFSKRPAPTMTALRVQDAPNVQKAVLEEHGVMVATGLSQRSKDLIRVGHMGNVDREQVYRTLDALFKVLKVEGRARPPVDGGGKPAAGS